MKQITLNHDAPCAGRLVMLGTLFGLAMLLIWQLAGPTLVGHVIAWGVAMLAGLKLWRMIEGA